MYDSLLMEAHSLGIDVDEQFHFKGQLKGLYVDGNIALSHELLNSAEKNCILAEELGHYYTSAGNIIDQTSALNRKQEKRARIWAYHRLASFERIVKAYQKPCFSLSDMAEYLEITESFLCDALSYYKSRYGEYAKYLHYILYFEPFTILEVYSNLGTDKENTDV